MRPRLTYFYLRTYFYSPHLLQLTSTSPPHILLLAAPPHPSLPLLTSASPPHILLLAAPPPSRSWVTPGNTYPLSRAVDYRPGVQHNGEHYSNFYLPPPAAPSALRPPFDSHYVCVRRGSYQCADGVRTGTLADYDELILKEAQQALPAYRCFFA